jgi:hypothetical protein
MRAFRGGRFSARDGGCPPVPPCTARLASLVPETLEQSEHSESTTALGDLFGGRG